MSKTSDLLILAVISVSQIGCVSENAQDSSFTQKDLDEITKNCGLTTQFLVLEAPKTVRLEPIFEENFEGVDCALTAVRKIPDLKIGFLGNEVYQSNQNSDPIKEGDEGS